MEQRQGNYRYFFMILFIVGMFILFFGRFFYLQILQHYAFSGQAQKFSQRKTLISAPRGRIFTRNGQLLVGNTSLYNVYLDKKTFLHSSLEDQKKTEKILYHTIQLNPKKLKQYLSSKDPYILLYRNLNLQTMGQLWDQALFTPGLKWERVPARIYHYRHLYSLSQTLGYMGQIDQKQYYQLIQQGYHINSRIGKSGIEQEYDKMLRGISGVQVRTFDAKGHPVPRTKYMLKKPRPGDDLYLTIDPKIQMAAQLALGAHPGAIVILRPSNGAILASVDYPNYNANSFNQNNSEQAFNQLLNNSNRPFLNRVIQGQYPAGSTFKIIDTLALLSDHSFNPYQLYACPGSIRLGRRVFHNWDHHNSGMMNLGMALSMSCDTYYYRQGIRMGPQTIVKYAKDMGLGQLTQIDLPDEFPGLVPSPEWAKIVKNQIWTKGDTANLSIGQGDLLVTPIQMANIMAMVANGGIVYKPHLLKSWENPLEGKKHAYQKQILLKDQQSNPFVWNTLQQMLHEATLQGEFRYIFTTRAVEVAGKTGTAEVGPKKGQIWHSWFVAYGPVDALPKNQIAIAILVEARKDQWQFRGPKAANIIFQSLFAHQSFSQALNTLNPYYKWIFTPSIEKEKQYEKNP